MCHDRVHFNAHCILKLPFFTTYSIRSRHYEAGTFGAMVEDKISDLGLLLEKASTVSARHGRREERGPCSRLQPISLYILYSSSLLLDHHYLCQSVQVAVNELVCTFTHVYTNHIKLLYPNVHHSLSHATSVWCVYLGELHSN